MKDGNYRSTLVAAWDRGTGRSVMAWTVVPQWIHNLAFSPDGRTLAAGVVPGIWLLDVAARRRPRIPPPTGPDRQAGVQPRRPTPGGRRRSGWGSLAGVQLWDFASGRPAGSS